MEFEWTTREHGAGERTPEWYLAVSIIVIAIAVTSIIFGNVLFAVVISVAFVALILSHKQTSQDIHVSIGKRGIRIDDYFYPYGNLDAYCVEEEKDQLILRSKKTFSSHIIVPLHDDIDREELDDFLYELLDHEEMHETVFEHFLEYLGF